MPPLVGSAVGLAGGSALFLATWGLLALARLVNRAEPMPATRHFWLTVAVLFAMSAVEELFFRAGVLGLGERLVGWPVALSISSVGFAASHAFPTRLTATAWLNLTLYGLLFGLAYLSGGLPMSIALHGSWNAWEWGSGFTVSGAKTSQLLPVPPVRRTVRGTPYGPEGHLAATVCCVIAVLVLMATTHIVPF